MEPVTPTEIEPPANVLLVHPNRTEPDACRTLRDAVDPTAECRVSFAGHAPNRPVPATASGRVGRLAVGDVLLEEPAPSPSAYEDDVVHDAVPDPTDLSAIGVAVSRFCKHWGDDRFALCFDSLDALLRYADPEAVFEFVHVLTNRLSSVDACAHFHFDPTRHGDRVVSTFGTIFDAVVAEDHDAALPEASDADVASVFSDATDVGMFGADRFGPRTEATDEDVERRLEN